MQWRVYFSADSNSFLVQRFNKRNTKKKHRVLGACPEVGGSRGNVFFPLWLSWGTRQGISIGYFEVIITCSLLKPRFTREIFNYITVPIFFSVFASFHYFLFFLNTKEGKGLYTPPTSGSANVMRNVRFTKRQIVTFRVCPEHRIYSAFSQAGIVTFPKCSSWQLPLNY